MQRRKSLIPIINKTTAYSSAKTPSPKSKTKYLSRLSLGSPLSYKNFDRSSNPFLSSHNSNVSNEYIVCLKNFKILILLFIIIFLFLLKLIRTQQKFLIKKKVYLLLKVLQNKILNHAYYHQIIKKLMRNIEENQCLFFDHHHHLLKRISIE